MPIGVIRWIFLECLGKDFWGRNIQAACVQKEEPLRKRSEYRAHKEEDPLLQKAWRCKQSWDSGENTEVLWGRDTGMKIDSAEEGLERYIYNRSCRASETTVGIWVSCKERWDTLKYL